MRISAERRLAASRETIWAQLNDLDTLRDCISGCEKLERVGENVVAAEVVARFGAVATRFDGTFAMDQIDAPSGCTVRASGSGGAAGFFDGRARVELVPDDEATLLRYHLEATVGGKLAQVGSRLIDAAARKMADDFFRRLAARLTPVEPAAKAEEPERSGLGPGIWVPLLIAFVILILYVFSRL